MWGNGEGREELKGEKWQLNKDLKKEREQPCLYLGKNFPGKRNSKHKCPAVGTCQACDQKSKEANVSAAEEGGKVLKNKSGATGEADGGPHEALQVLWPGMRWTAWAGCEYKTRLQFTRITWEVVWNTYRGC